MSADQYLRVIISTHIITEDWMGWYSPVVAVSVCGAVDVLDDGRYPHGVEAHVLDVAEVVGDPRPGAAAVCAQGRVTRGGGVVRRREPVGEELRWAGE
jgi:hypothetical protein